MTARSTDRARSPRKAKPHEEAITGYTVIRIVSCAILEIVVRTQNLLTVGCVAALLLAACTHRAPAPRTFAGVPLAPNVTCYDAACRSYNVQPYVLTRSRFGIGCLGNVPPGTTPVPLPPPQSYLAKDIGKPGFPTVEPGERAVARRIVHYVHSATLRIAWVHDAAGYAGREFIVFDATRGPCEVGAPGDAVLNGACNEYYQPGENPYYTHPTPSCYPTKRPWMTTTR